MPSSESIFDKYNMSAAERRLVMSVVVVLVVVLAWTAFTSIDDPGETNAKIVKAENNIKKFKAEIAKDAGYKKRIAELEGMNSAVENRNQEVDLRSKVARLKRESGLNIFDLGKQTSKPGDFFVEQSMRIQFNGKEDQIVNFLMRLGGDEDSLMRISRFSVSPDGRSNPTKLRGLATVTASYQKDYIAPPTEETGEGTAEPSGTSELAAKSAEPAKPSTEQAVGAKEETETKPEAKPKADPPKTKRIVPSRRVRKTQ